MNIKSDLIDEEVGKELIEINENDEFFDVCSVELDEEKALEYNKKKGLYLTINLKMIPNYNNLLKIKNNLIMLINKAINYYNMNIKNILIVGIGNENVTPDSLGPKVIKFVNLDCNKYRVMAIAPNVFLNTGIESATYTEALVKKLNIDLVIAVDALSARSSKRLFRSIQIASSGVTPGSGVMNKRKEFSKKSLGCEVLAIGVPTVCDLGSILNDYQIYDIDDNYFLTVKDVDELIVVYSNIIAESINSVLEMK